MPPAEALARDLLGVVQGGRVALLQVRDALLLLLAPSSALLQVHTRLAKAILHKAKVDAMQQREALAALIDTFLPSDRLPTPVSESGAAAAVETTLLSPALSDSAPPSSPSSSASASSSCASCW